jgi:hypothetical protein
MPYQDADHRLRALAGRAEGFGRHAIGGLHGTIYRVTSLQGTYDPAQLALPIVEPNN